MADNFNGVPYVPGTGGATIYGNSKAADEAPSNFQNILKSGLLNVRKTAVDQNQAYKDYQDNMIKAQSGGLFSNELNGYVQKWIDKGAKYLSQGFDIYRPDPNNPSQVQASNQYMQEKHQIEAMSDLAKLHNENYKEQNKVFQQGGYDEDGLTALHDFYDTKNNPNRLLEIFKTGATTPTLMKAYDEQKLLKGIHPAFVQNKKVVGNQEILDKTANRAAIQYNIENAIRHDPQALRAYSKQLGFNPAKDLFNTTNPDEVTKLLDDHFRSPGAGAAEVDKAGITSFDSPEYRKFLNDHVQAQVDREQDYKGLVKRLVNSKANEVDPRHEVTPNFEAANQARANRNEGRADRRLSMEELRLQHSEEEWNEKKDDKNTRDKLIQGLQVGNTDDVQALRGILKAKGGNVGYKPDGTMVVDYQSIGQGGAPVPHHMEVNLSDGNDSENYAQFNELVNKITGKNIPYDKQAGTLGYQGGLVNIGSKSLKKEQISYLRDKFVNDYKGLGSMLKNNGFFSTDAEAYKAAVEILDKKGRRAIIK
jgi:hypothetical protein